MRAISLASWAALVVGCGRSGFEPARGADATTGGADATTDGRRADGGGVADGCTARCGPAGTSDCCARAMVPGNAPGAGMSGDAFYRGYDEAADAYNDQGFPATVSDFRLDTYEVTVGRFRAFVDAGYGTQANPPAVGAGAHPRLPGSGWAPSWTAHLRVDANALRTSLRCHPTYQTWTDLPGGNEELPINCVSFYDAMAFCIWDGGYLPTEAEWNYVAAGGSEQRAYPWSVPASSLAIDATYATYAGDAPAAVGSKPRGNGRWGHADLGGNVWEWVLDWQVTPYPLPCDDCAALTPTTFRLNRGGDFRSVEVTLRTASRGVDDEDTRFFYDGLRCARAP